MSVDFLCIVRALFFEKKIFLRAWNILSIHKNCEINWRLQRSSIVSKKINRRKVTSPHKGLEPLTVGLKSNALPTALAGLKDSASLKNLIFQIQEFEAVAPEINNLLYIFFAAISDLEGLLFSLLGWLDPTTFRLIAERASRLRHKSSITCVGWFFYASFELCSLRKVYFWEPETY